MKLEIDGFDDMTHSIQGHAALVPQGAAPKVQTASCATWKCEKL